MMTINRLIKELQKLEKKYGKRVTVCADTQALRSTCNDVWPIVDLNVVEPESIPQVDGDGWSKYRKDGMECHRFCVVLK